MKRKNSWSAAPIKHKRGEIPFWELAIKLERVRVVMITRLQAAARRMLSIMRLTSNFRGDQYVWSHTSGPRPVEYLNPYYIDIRHALTRGTARYTIFHPHLRFYEATHRSPGRLGSRHQRVSRWSLFLAKRVNNFEKRIQDWNKATGRYAGAISESNNWR